MNAIVERVMNVVSRITPATLLVRGAAFVLTTAALVMAIPTFLYGPQPILAAAVGGVVVALAPGSRVVTVVLLAAGVGWGMAYADRLDQISPLGLVAFGSVLYLAHSSAALAALIPYDAVVTPEVLVRWYVRAVAVVAGSAVISLSLLVGVWALAGFNGTAVASLAGLAAAVALVVLGARMVRVRG